MIVCSYELKKAKEKITNILSTYKDQELKTKSIGSILHIISKKYGFNYSNLLIKEYNLQEIRINYCCPLLIKTNLQTTGLEQNK